MPIYRGMPRVFLIGLVGTVTFASLASALQGRGAATVAGIEFIAEVPLLDCDGTPCVDARVGESKIVRLGIDTGNVDSVVDSKVAEAAGLKPLAPPKPGAPAGMFRTVFTSIHMGPLTLINVPAMG